MTAADITAARAIMDKFPPLLETMDPATHQRRPLSYAEWLGMRVLIAEGLAAERAEVLRLEAIRQAELAR